MLPFRIPRFSVCVLLAACVLGLLSIPVTGASPPLQQQQTFEVQLAWTANPAAEQITAYRIYEGATQVGEATAGATSLTLQNVTPGLHTYIVKPVGPWGEGPPSDPASTPPAATKTTGISVTVIVKITSP